MTTDCGLVFCSSDEVDEIPTSGIEVGYVQMDEVFVFSETMIMNVQIAVSRLYLLKHKYAQSLQETAEKSILNLIFANEVQVLIDEVQASRVELDKVASSNVTEDQCAKISKLREQLQYLDTELTNIHSQLKARL